VEARHCAEMSPGLVQVGASRERAEWCKCVEGGGRGGGRGGWRGGQRGGGHVVKKIQKRGGGGGAGTTVKKRGKGEPRLKKKHLRQKRLLFGALGRGKNEGRCRGGNYANHRTSIKGIESTVRGKIEKTQLPRKGLCGGEAGR